MQLLVDQLKALGESNRLAVLILLRKGPASANQLLSQLAMSQPSLSRHIRILREAGLIAEERQGRTHVYSLINSPLTTLVLTQTSHAPRPIPSVRKPRSEPDKNINEKTYDEAPGRRDSFQDWLD